MRYRTLLFDLDGTLIDHFKAIRRCHVHTLSRMGLPAPSMAEVRAAVGGGLETALARLAGPGRVQEALPLFSAHWDATMLDDVELMPDALGLLERARAAGLTSAVLTNKRGPSARSVCDHLGLTPFLADVFGANDTPWLKPDPRFVAHALARLKATPGTTCLIGDSPYDLDTARNAGLAFIGITTGTHSAEQLREAGASEICSSLVDVGSLVLPDQAA
jgi:phosphoglycolate phosphatase